MELFLLSDANHIVDATKRLSPSQIYRDERRHIACIIAFNNVEHRAWKIEASYGELEEVNSSELPRGTILHKIDG